MKIQINVDKASPVVLKALVQDRKIQLNSLNFRQMYRVLSLPDVNKPAGCIDIQSVLMDSTISQAKRQAILEMALYREAIWTTPYVVQNNQYQKVKENFEVLFDNMKKITALDSDKDYVRELYWNYIERYNAQPLLAHVHPANLPEWAFKKKHNTYDGIMRRIAMHTVTDWKFYNTDNPDTRAPVRAAHADRFGTTKMQAILDTSLVLRLRAVKEHNIKI